nr:reverse transcriptase domain-containing protein [Tanacetum cinerariifolium]
MEKLVLALVYAAKRLRRYFQAHPIMVITDPPIKQVISRQILADFLVEKPDGAPLGASVIETPQEPWTLFTDESSCVDGSGAGLILTSPEGTEFTYTLRFQFTASNNEAEYEALIARLRIAAQMGVRNVHILPGASHHGHHRPAHQASDFTSRRGKAIAKMERHARGAQYHIPPRTSVKGQILADFLVEKPDGAPLGASVIETLNSDK